jgi:hypothetical protein
MYYLGLAYLPINKRFNVFLCVLYQNVNIFQSYTINYSLLMIIAKFMMIFINLILSLIGASFLIFGKRSCYFLLMNQL